MTLILYMVKTDTVLAPDTGYYRPQPTDIDTGGDASSVLTVCTLFF